MTKTNAKQTTNEETSKQDEKIDPLAAIKAMGFEVLDTPPAAAVQDDLKYNFEAYPAPMKYMEGEVQKTHYFVKTLVLADLGIKSGAVKSAIKKHYERLTKAGTKEDDLPKLQTSIVKDKPGKDGKEIAVKVWRSA